jgi:hypothetical protein
VNAEEAVWLISLALIIAGVAMFVVTAVQRGRLRELAHRERIAMIERGLAPPPEVDPARFERAMGQPDWDEEVLARSGRFRRGGVLIMGVGLALWFMITFAGENPGAGFGVGGAIVVLGAALYFISSLELKHARPRTRHATARPSPPPSEPRSSNVEP